MAAYPFTFRNDSGHTVPAFGLIEIEDWEIERGELIGVGMRPSSDGGNHYYVNGPVDVGEGKHGDCTNIFPAWVRLETGTPVAGRSWGVKADSFKLHQQRHGYTAHGGPTENERALFVPDYSLARVRLSEDKETADGSVDAVFRYWNGSAFATSTETLTLKDDFLAIFEGSTDDDMFAIWKPDRKAYEIVQKGCAAA